MVTSTLSSSYQQCASHSNVAHRKHGPLVCRIRDPANQLTIEPYKEYKVSDEPVLGYTIPSEIAEEDATILDSLGPIVDRENENLSVIDCGIVLIRQMYLKQVEALKAGKDPKEVIRKATDDLIVVGGRYGWMSNDEYNQLARARA